MAWMMSQLRFALNVQPRRFATGAARCDKLLDHDLGRGHENSSSHLPAAFGIGFLCIWIERLFTIYSNEANANGIGTAIHDGADAVALCSGGRGDATGWWSAAAREPIRSTGVGAARASYRQHFVLSHFSVTAGDGYRHHCGDPLVCSFLPISAIFFGSVRAKGGLIKAATADEHDSLVDRFDFQW